MRGQFAHIPESGKKQRGFVFLILMILIVTASSFVLSCADHNVREVEPYSILEQPAYHLAPYRSEFAILFHESPECVGSQILGSIFLFNYKEDRMEASFEAPIWHQAQFGCERDTLIDVLHSVLSSYMNYGKYKITGTAYNMVTEDGKYTFIFHKQGDSFVFDAEYSARCILENGTELPNGAVFSVKY